MAVTLGTTARLLVAQDVSMTAMTVLPLSLIPTFIVPLLTISHVICIVQASAWKSAPGNTVHTERLVNGSVAGHFYTPRII